MKKNPYYEDWLRKIAAMSEEELSEVINAGNYDNDFLKLAKERLAYIKNGESSDGIWRKRIEGADIKVESHEDTESPTTYVDNGAENTLLFIAKAELIIGIFASIILLLASVASGQIIGVAAAVTTFVFSLVTWAALKVFANISKTLKEIKGQIPKA